MKELDINVDIGEGFNIEAEIMPLIQSCNIACGGHAGNNKEMSKLISLARQNNVKIGVHPSYPDKDNFGRISMNIDKKKLKYSIKSQLLNFIKLLNDSKELNHVKPHGALYNDCATNENIATILIECIHECCPNATLFTLPESKLAKKAKSKGIIVCKEAFLDRGYMDNGQLQPRDKKGALITSSHDIFKRLKNLLLHDKIQTINNNWINIDADTYCLHGDHPNIVENLKDVLSMYNKII